MTYKQEGNNINKRNRKSYIDALANLSLSIHRLLHQTNLIKRFLTIDLIIIVCAGLAEVGIDMVTKLTFYGVNIIRGFSYEKPVAFHADHISALMLGNVATLILTVIYMAYEHIKHLLYELWTPVKKAERKIQSNKK